MDSQIKEASFEDGRTFKIGTKVRVSTKYCTDCIGEVIGFGKELGTVTIKVMPDEGTVYGRLDRWLLAPGVQNNGYNDYNRLRDRGVFGGEIVEIIGEAK